MALKKEGSHGMQLARTQIEVEVDETPKRSWQGRCANPGGRRARTLWFIVVVSGVIRSHTRRRAGVVLNKEVNKDEEGFDDIDAFWSAASGGIDSGARARSCDARWLFLNARRNNDG